MSTTAITTAPPDLQFGEATPHATPQAALARLMAVRPAAYARSRNHLQGAVTGLSPYLTHGLLTLPQVLSHLGQVHGLDAQHKLVFELGWRAYFAHVWRCEGPQIFESMRSGVLPDSAYAHELPADIRQATTGLPVIDQAVRCLYNSGYLHNHARMWLASYVVHLRKVHWRAGADWMVGHLLDGDLASNHLSWQWVAGTASARPYLFNAANVARYAPPDWHCAGSVIDTTYEVLQRVAADPAAVLLQRGPRLRGSPPSQEDDAAAPSAWGISEPPLQHQPDRALMQALAWQAPNAETVRGQDVWLVHPWCLADPPAGCMAVAVLDADFFVRWPWSERRWRFVTARMQALTRHRWWGSNAAILQALQSARSVRGVYNLHLGPNFAPQSGERVLPLQGAVSGALSGKVPAAVQLSLSPEPAPFLEPTVRCRSFSAYWAKVNQHPIPALQASHPKHSAPSHAPYEAPVQGELFK